MRNVRHRTGLVDLRNIFPRQWEQGRRRSQMPPWWPGRLISKHMGAFLGTAGIIGGGVEWGGG